MVGEIGFDWRAFLFTLRWWQIRAIIEGYRRRERTYCMMTRWSTYMTMSCGMADLKKAGIYSPEDLMQLPWDKESIPDISDDEIDEQRRRIQEANKKNGSQ